LSNEVSSIEAIKQRIIKALKKVYDPEIPINVMDLGLIYDIEVAQGPEIKIKYTLTAPGCPIAPLIDAQIIEVVKSAVPEAKKIETELVFDPPWTPLRISPEGREQLKILYGYDIVEEWVKRYGGA